MRRTSFGLHQEEDEEEHCNGEHDNRIQLRGQRPQMQICVSIAILLLTSAGLMAMSLALH